MGGKVAGQASVLFDSFLANAIDTELTQEPGDVGELVGGHHAHVDVLPATGLTTMNGEDVLARLECVRGFLGDVVRLVIQYVSGEFLDPFPGQVDPNVVVMVDI